MKPKISVVMPVYNASKYLHEAIQSILNQTFSDFELLILNDNSKDDSLEIIQDFIKNDNRIILINKDQNIGPALLRNEGFESSKGEFIALMDADDIAHPKRFEKQIAVFNNDSEIGVCGTWYTMFGEKIEEYIFKQNEFHEAIKVKLLYESCIGNPTAMIRKSVLHNQKYNPVMVPIEDYDLWTRLINNTKFYNIQESLLRYRWHETNITKSKEENSKKMHQIVFTNQLKEFGIDLNTPNLNLILDTIFYRKRYSSKDIYTILENKKFLIHQNRIIKKYDFDLFEKQLNLTAIRTFSKCKDFNLKLFLYFYKNEKNNFNKIKLTLKIKIFLKSLFRFSKN